MAANTIERDLTRKTVPIVFNLQELGGALGDLGTLLPLMVALVLVNGLNATSVLVGAGLFYIAAGLYFRIPIPVQPLKAVAAISIALSLSSGVISAAGLLMGVILLVLSLTNLINVVTRLFPQPVVKGIQLSIGLTLLKKAIGMIFSNNVFSGNHISPNLQQLPIGIFLGIATILIFVLFNFYFFKRSQRFTPSLALLTFGVGCGFTLGSLPSLHGFAPSLPTIALPTAADFWIALTVLVIPQLPLTLGNAVVSTRDAANTYFEDQPHRVSARTLTTSMGLANVAAGLVGAMPMCHGSGGLTAHYKLGARTAGASLMIGGLLLVLGLVFGRTALAFFSLIPLSVLGVLLAVVGIYHGLLVLELRRRRELIVAGVVAIVTVLFDNLAYGFGAGILLYWGLRWLSLRPSPATLSSIDRQIRSSKT